MQQQSPVLLEDYLRSLNPPPLTATPPPPSATSILQSWSNLRSPSTPPHLLLSSLQTLHLARSSLHISPSQAQLLLSLPLHSSPIVPSLLSLFLRRSPNPSPQILQQILSLPPSPFPPFILLLGSLASVPSLPPPSRTASLDRLCSLLGSFVSTSTKSEPDLSVINQHSAHENLADSIPDSSGTNKGSIQNVAESDFSRIDRCSSENAGDSGLSMSDRWGPGDVAELLAGIGYALSCSDDAHFRRIFGYLFRIWDVGSGDGRGVIKGSVGVGIMILGLVEWCASGFIGTRDWGKLELLCKEIGGSVELRDCARFAIVMACSGVIRALRSHRVEVDDRIKRLVEEPVGFVAEYAIFVEGSKEGRLLLQCIAVGLARCGSISFNRFVIQSLCLSLLNEIFPLMYFFRVLVQPENDNLIGGELGGKVKEHIGSVLFKEAGTVTGIFCNQYSAADEESRAIVEGSMWTFSQDLYSNLRVSILLIRGKSDELLSDLEKVAEAAFLMVVVFAAEVSKNKLNSKSGPGYNTDVAVRILVAFSCIEYLRRVRLPEYTDAVRQAVLTIQDNATSSSAFVDSMPSYAELTTAQGSILMERTEYLWSQDDVQTARMLFYLRVIPACISLISASVFAKRIAPIMFLYLQHPNEKVARASHSVFVSFLSSSKDSDNEERNDVKEQLVFFYIQRSLEAFPGLTPFEGLASGIVAIARHLPAGSPAIFYSVHSLVGKASELCKKASSEDMDMWKNWEGNTGPSKKVIDLLLRLISLVDIQVLPFLLKQLAEFVVQLPSDGQNALLDLMHSLVAESDDVTRKPALVSWLQSLSYLCSQKISKNASLTKDDLRQNVNSLSNNDGLFLNRTSSRL